MCTLNIIFIVFCPQTDFEKDVDMACRSGKLQLDCSLSTFDYVFACAFDVTLGTALQQLQMSLCASSLFFLFFFSAASNSSALLEQM